MRRLTTRVFYGWWIVVAGSVAMGLYNGLFSTGFGFFFEPIRQYFHWNRTVISGAFALSRLEGAILGPFVGYLIQRLGPRAIMTVAFVAFGTGFVLLARSNSILTFYIALLILAAGADNPGFLAIMASINNWFRSHRSRAIGYAMVGSGLGGVIFPPILAYGLDNFSWRTVCVFAGIFVFGAGVVISRIVRYSPEPYGYLPYGVSGNSERQANLDYSGTRAQKTGTDSGQIEYDYGMLEALKTPAFWIISIGHAQALLVISAITLHQVPFLEVEMAFAKSSAAHVVMVVTAASMVGQVIGGFLGDRFSKHYLAAGTILGHSGALLLLASANGYLMVMLSAVVQGIAWGVRTPILTSMRGDYFGRKSFAFITGSSQGIGMLGMITGSLLVGYFADHFTYRLGFTVIAACAIPGALLFLILRSPNALD